MPPEIHWSHVRNNTRPEEDLRDPAFQLNNRLFDTVIHKGCAAALGPQLAYRCAIPYVLYPHITTPLFVTEALSDVVVLCGFEGMYCKLPQALERPDVWVYIDEYARNATLALSVVFNNSRNGLFAPSCLIHCGLTLDGPLIDGINGIQAVWQWVQQTNPPPGTYQHMDACKTYFPPCGHKCPAPSEGVSLMQGSLQHKIA